ncbi:class II fructose-1,6-bisphosphate aldolase [Candidatus Woesearchaeota archaeon]|nr:class II fructose-1,6-bisphosphate aldolase [Candidatus Woesearchaeota archaeon]
MITTSKELLDKAYKNKYAVGHFNIYNLETIQSVINACEKLNSPAILATSEGAIEYAGHKELFLMIKTLAEESKVPFAIHLDHGRNSEIIKKCIQLGYTSIMFDGSKKEFEENVKQTEKVVNLCEDKNISVEGELGTIGGAEEDVTSRKILLTDSNKAKEFIERTGIDCLAVAIGTSHGAYKFVASKRPQLDIRRLQEINKLCQIPLVLHGASEVPKQLVKLANKYGAKIKDVRGVPLTQLKQAIKNGIAKVNTDTDLRLAFTSGIRHQLAVNKTEFNPRSFFSEGKKEMQKVVEQRIKELGSEGRV